MEEARPPLSPFAEETVRTRDQAAEDARNSWDPERVALAYTEGSQRGSRDEFFKVCTTILSGREPPEHQAVMTTWRNALLVVGFPSLSS